MYGVWRVDEAQNSRIDIGGIERLVIVDAGHGHVRIG